MDMIFSVRQLQEKCREQRRPLFIAFIDLTKAFDLVSRRGLFNLLEKIGCPPKLLSVISSFHNNMKGTVNYDGATSQPFDIHSGVKQRCVTEVLERASSFSMYTLLSQRRLRWLGHVHRMANGRIPKYMLYGELVTGTRTVGRPYLRYRDTRYMQTRHESGGNRHYDMGGSRR